MINTPSPTENTFFFPRPDASPEQFGSAEYQQQRRNDFEYLGNYMLSPEYEDSRKKADERYLSDPYANAPEYERKYMVGRKIVELATGSGSNPDMYFRNQNKPLPENIESKEELYGAVYDDMLGNLRQAKQKEIEQQKAYEEYGAELIGRIEQSFKGDLGSWTPKDVETMEKLDINPGIINRVRNAYQSLSSLEGFYVSDEDAARVMVAAGLNKDEGSLTPDDRKTKELLLNLWSRLAYDGYGNAIDRKFDSGIAQFAYNQVKPIDNFLLKGEAGIRRTFGNMIAMRGESRTDFADSLVQRGSDIPFETQQPRYGSIHNGERDEGMIRTINFRTDLKNAQAAAEQAYEEGRNVDFISGVAGSLGDIVGQSAMMLAPYVGALSLLGSSQTMRFEEGRALELDDNENAKRSALFGIADTAEELTGLAFVGRIPWLGKVVNRGLAKGVEKTGIMQSPLRAKYLASETAQMFGHTVAGVIEEGITEPIIGGTLRNIFNLALDDERGKASWSDIPEDMAEGFSGTQGWALLLYSRGFAQIAKPAIRANVKQFMESMDGFQSLGGSEKGYMQAMSIKDDQQRHEFIQEHLNQEWVNNPDLAAQRAENGNLALLAKEEVSQLREMESFKALQARGVLPRFEPSAESGKYRVYVDESFAETTKETETEDSNNKGYSLMTEEQLNTFLTLSIGERERNTIVWAQNLLAAENATDYLAEKGWKIEDIGQTETTDSLRLMARQAVAATRLLEASGMTREDALREVVPNVSENVNLGNVINIYSASKGRVATARRRGEADSFRSDAYVVRQHDPVNGGFQQILRVARGEATIENIWEETMEQAAIDWCVNENITMETLGSQLQEMQRIVNDIYKNDKNMQFIGLNSAPTRGDSIEALSLIGRSRLMNDVVNGNSNLPAWVQKLIKFLTSMLEPFRAKIELGGAIRTMEESGQVSPEIKNFINEMSGAVDAIYASDARTEAEITQEMESAIAVHEATLAGKALSQKKTIESIKAELDGINSRIDSFIKENVSKDLLGRLKNPEESGMTEDDTYTICQLSTDADVQKWAGEQIQKGYSIDEITPGIQLRDAVANGEYTLSDSEIDHISNYVNTSKRELSSMEDSNQAAELMVAYNNIGAHPEIIEAGKAWKEGDLVHPAENVSSLDPGIPSIVSENIVRDGKNVLFAASLEKARDNTQDITFSILPSEKKTIVDTAKKNETYLKAPNGKNSNLTESQWAIVRTKAFKKWFGDWENDPANASKVIDENGEPLVVYHGAPNDFGNIFEDIKDSNWDRAFYDRNYSSDTFWFADKKFTAQSYQTGLFTEHRKGELKKIKQESKLAPPRVSIENTDYVFYEVKNGVWTKVDSNRAILKNGKLRKGYLSTLELKDEKLSTGYVPLSKRLTQYNDVINGRDGAPIPLTHKEAVDDFNDSQDIGDSINVPANSRLYEVFLNIRNPYVENANGERFRKMGNKAREAKSRGNDGLVVEDVRDPGNFPTLIENGKSIAVFSSNQIKSATPNNGAFDASNPDITFSLAQASAISKMVLAPRANEAKAKSLMRGIDEAMKRWNIASSGQITQEDASRSFGEMNAIMAEVQRVLPDGYKVNMRPYQNLAAIYSHMMGNGQIRSYGKLTPEGRAAFAEEARTILESPETMAAVRGEISETVSVEDEVKGKGSKKIEEAYRKENERIVKELAEGRLNGLISDMMTDVKNNLEKYLKDEVVGKTLDRLARLMPKKKESGKYGKGSLSADAYRSLGQYVAMLDSEAATVDAEVAKLEHISDQLSLDQQSAKGDEVITANYEFNGLKESLSLDQLVDKIGDWRTFGNLESMGLDAARSAMESLMTFMQLNKTAWATKNQIQSWQNEKIASDISKGIRSTITVNDQTIRDAKEDERSRPKMWTKAWFSGFQSFSQLLEGLRETEGLAELCDYGIKKIAEANVSLNTRENNHVAAFNRIIKDAAGLKTDREAQDWVIDSKRTQDTGIVLSPAIKRSVTMDIQTAMDYLELSRSGDRAGFEAKRQEIVGKAKEQGIRPERLGLISEMDVSVLEEAMAKNKRAQKITITTIVHSKNNSTDPLRISKAQAMYQILLYEQERYKNNFESHGYTKESMATLYQFVGPEGLEVAYGLRDYINEQGKELAEVFERINGTPFPREENYFRAKFEHNEGDAKPAVIGENKNIFGHKYSMLITRRNHNLGLDLSVDAFAIANASLAESDNYICTKEITNKFRSVLSHGYAADALKVKMGSQRYKQLVTWIDLIDGAGTMEAAQLTSHSKFVGRMQSAKAMALLSWNMLTCIKQTSAILHPMSSGRIGFGELVKEYGRMMSGQGHFSFKDLIEKDIFKSRFRNNQVLRDILNYGADQNFGYGMRAAMAGMEPMEKMDVWSNALSHAAYANAVYSSLEKDNQARISRGEDALSVKEMEDVAMNEVRVAMELGAQPLRNTQKSQWQAIGGTFVRIWTFMGSESINKFGNLVTFAQRGEWGKVTNTWLGMSLYEQVIVALWQIAVNPPPDDEEERNKFWVTHAFSMPTAMLGAVPVVGATIETFFQAFGALPYYSNYGSSIIPTGTVFGKTRKAIKDDATWEDAIEASLAALQMFAIGGGVFSNSRSKAVAETTSGIIGASAVTNPAKQAVKAVKARED